MQAWLDRYLYSRCETVIVASATLSAWLDQAVVVPPGRDQKAGTEVSDLRQGARAAALCVANWLPNKGILDLLDAARHLARRRCCACTSRATSGHTRPTGSG